MTKWRKWKTPWIDPLPVSPDNDEDQALDLSHRCWRDPIDDDVWLTDFPPPPGFDGHESRPYDEQDSDQKYERECTEEEVAILEVDEKAVLAAERADDEQLRDAWFALLREEAGR